ncbi:hypothetical protein ACOME3_010038 [Neoechinorhynchus agilis]
MIKLITYLTAAFAITIDLAVGGLCIAHATDMMKSLLGQDLTKRINDWGSFKQLLVLFFGIFAATCLIDLIISALTILWIRCRVGFAVDFSSYVQLLNIIAQLIIVFGTLLLIAHGTKWMSTKVYNDAQNITECPGETKPVAEKRFCELENILAAIFSKTFAIQITIPISIIVSLTSLTIGVIAKRAA